MFTLVFSMGSRGVKKARLILLTLTLILKTKKNFFKKKHREFTMDIFFPGKA